MTENKSKKKFLCIQGDSRWWEIHWSNSKCNELQVRSRTQTSCPGQCIVVLGKIYHLLTSSASPAKSINAYQQINKKAWWNTRGRGGNLAMDWLPIQGKAVLLLGPSCLGNQNKLQLGRPLGLSTDLTYQKSLSEVRYPFCCFSNNILNILTLQLFFNKLCSPKCVFLN